MKEKMKAFWDKNCEIIVGGTVMTVYGLGCYILGVKAGAVSEDAIWIQHLLSLGMKLKDEQSSK